MKRIKWSEDKPTIALLIKTSAFYQNYLDTHYIKPTGLDESEFTAFDLYYNEHNKATARTIKEYLTELLPFIKDSGVKILYVADANYFKVLTKNTKTETMFGYAVQCVYEGYEDYQAVLTYNYQSLFHNPANQQKMDLSVNVIIAFMGGQVKELGTDVIKFSVYPETVHEIGEWLDKLHQYPELTCDIECFDLKHYKAGLGTISFAWNKHEGIAFAIDYRPCPPYTGEIWCTKDKKMKTRTMYGTFEVNQEVRSILKQFFITYTGKLIWHNCTFDLRTIIYVLWMDSIIDQHGLLEGREIMTRDFEDTKVISYLATNSCAGNKLSLKEQAFEFLGDYGIL